MPTFQGQGGVQADTRKFGPRTFIFQPGGTAEGNVYTDWNLLYADLSNTPGTKIIVLDDEFVALVPIPNGTFDLTDCTLTNAGVSHKNASENKTSVTWGTTTQLQDVSRWENLWFYAGSSGLGSPIVYTKDRSVTMVGSWFLGQFSSDPIIQSIPAGSQIDLLWELQDSSFGYIPSGGGFAIPSEPVLSLAGAGDTVGFKLKGNSLIASDAVLGGASDSITSITVDPGSYFRTSQPGFAGSIPTIPWGAEAVNFDSTGLTNISAFTVDGALRDLDTAISGAGAVSSVFSRTGAVVAATSDYDAIQVDYDPSGLNIVTSTNVQAAVADLDSAVNSSGVQTNAVFLSKTGNDSNSGLSPRLAKLTVASAITAASGLTPNSTNRVVIHILDAGIYQNGANLTLPDYVSLVGPAATLETGGITRTLFLGEDSLLQLARTNAFGISALNVSGRAWVTIENLVTTAFGLAASDGILYADIEYLETGTGNGVSVGGTGVVRGRVGTINITGAGKGVSYGSTSASCLICGCILAPSGEAVQVSNVATNLDIVATFVQGSPAYNVAGLGTLNIAVARRVGSVSGAGTINELSSLPVADDGHQLEVAIVPASTVNSYFFAPDDITIVAIKAYTETVPVTAGVYTVAVEDVSGAPVNLLLAATENLKTLGAATLTSFSLTATTANLSIAEGTRVRIQVVSDNGDLVATGVYVQIIYRSQ